MPFLPEPGAPPSRTTSSLGCLFSAAWVLMEPEVAAVASCVVLSTVYLVVSEARRIHHRFFLEADETISFTELQAIYPQIAKASSSMGLGSPARDPSLKNV